MFFNKKILIVDDSPIVAQLVKKILIENRYEIIDIVSSVDEAIMKLIAEKWDMLLLDYNMPEKNGEVLLDHVKEQYPEIVVIMLSGQQEKDIVVKLMRKSDDYIVKDDVSAIRDELIYAIQHAFELQNLKEENKALVDKIKKRNKTLEDELNIAKRLLKEIYPKKVEKSKAFSISMHNWPLNVIGGDFYYISRLDPNKVGIFVGDICGHGIGAALLLFTLSNAYKEVIKNSSSTKETMTKLNIQLFNQFPLGSFVTCCYFVLDEEKAVIHYSTAFDTPILYLTADKKIEEIVSGELAYVGLIDTDDIIHQGKDFFQEASLTLKDGEKIFIMTDGAVETRNSKKELFGSARLKNIILENSTKSLDEIIKAIYDAALAYSNNNIADDITIIGLEKKK